MTLATKTWSFASDAESWSASPASGVTMQWISTDGSPASGCLSSSLIGKNQNPGVGYWEITGTWESLFAVPAGATVNTIAKLAAKSGPYNWRCSVWNLGTGTNNSGPLEVWDSAGTTLIATIANAETSVTSTTTWAAAGNTGSQSIGASYQASSTSIRLRMSVTLRTGNDKAAQVDILQDEVALEVDYTASGTLHQVTVTDGADAGDTESAVVTYPVSNTEGADAGDTLVASLTVPVSLTEGADLGEVFDAIKLVAVAALEGIDLGEVFTPVLSLGASLQEGAYLGETWAAIASMGVSISDQAEAGDSENAVATFRVTMGD